MSKGESGRMSEEEKKRYSGSKNIKREVLRNKIKKSKKAGERLSKDLEGVSNLGNPFNIARK